MDIMITHYKMTGDHNVEVSIDLVHTVRPSSFIILLHFRLANSENMFSYYINTVRIMDMFRVAILRLRDETGEIILGEIAKVDQEYAMGIFILIILFIISPLMVFLVRNAVNALQVFSSSVRVKARALKKEKRKAENLITQMLPRSVAENLKQNKSTSEVRILKIFKI